MGRPSSAGQVRKACSGQSLTVDLESLFRELQAAPKDESGALTTREIVDLTGKSFYAVDNLIREACSKGLMRPVKVRREARDLTTRTTTGYKMIV